MVPLGIQTVIFGVVQQRHKEFGGFGLSRSMGAPRWPRWCFSRVDDSSRFKQNGYMVHYHGRFGRFQTALPSEKSKKNFLWKWIDEYWWPFPCVQTQVASLERQCIYWRQLPRSHGNAVSETSGCPGGGVEDEALSVLNWDLVLEELLFLHQTRNAVVLSPCVRRWFVEARDPKMVQLIGTHYNWGIPINWGSKYVRCHDMS